MAEAMQRVILGEVAAGELITHTPGLLVGLVREGECYIWANLQVRQQFISSSLRPALPRVPPTIFDP